VEGFQRLLRGAETQERLAQAGQRVLVVGIEDEGLLEAAPRPRVFLARQTGIANADM
jgi:hypothetical protein